MNNIATWKRTHAHTFIIKITNLKQNTTFSRLDQNKNHEDIGPLVLFTFSVFLESFLVTETLVLQQSFRIC